MKILKIKTGTMENHSFIKTIDNKGIHLLNIS